MKKVTKIPEDFLLEIPLNVEQERVLIDQINRFNELKEKELYPISLEVSEDGRVLLKEGTIIHGVSSVRNIDKLVNISKSGILTGQAIGISEDGETYYCADFHRVSRDMSMKEFNDDFTYVDGRCPFGNGIRGSGALAFVIEPREEADELFKYDCYRNDTNESKLTRNFVNVAGLPGNAEIMSSILYGVPSNMFCGIVLGNQLLERNGFVELIVKMFPDCYVSTIDGVIIYNPSVDMNYSEVVKLRAEKYCLEFKNKLLQKDLNDNIEKNRFLEIRNRELVDTMMRECPTEIVVKILNEKHLIQGPIEYIREYVEKIKEESMHIKK